MRERSSLESAFLRFWPSPKAQDKSISMAAVNHEVTDTTGMGLPYGWSGWNLDGEQFGVQCRVSMGDGTSIQFRNISDQIKKVSAEHGSRRFTLTLNPGQGRDLSSKGDDSWHWTVLL
jgi:hypothetical protein